MSCEEPLSWDVRISPRARSLRDWMSRKAKRELALSSEYINYPCYLNQKDAIVSWGERNGDARIVANDYSGDFYDCDWEEVARVMTYRNGCFQSKKAGGK